MKAQCKFWKGLTLFANKIGAANESVKNIILNNINN